MKKVAVLLVSLVGVWALTSLQAADSVSVEPRLMFYGRISSVDATAKTLTVHNKKRKLDATFRWDESTSIILNKQALAARDLKVGQSLSVAYVVENNTNRATKIVVKKTPNPSQAG